MAEKLLVDKRLPECNIIIGLFCLLRGTILTNKGGEATELGLLIRNCSTYIVEVAVKKVKA
ncbi:MAG TPA: hypothetical protein HPP56_04085 [Nitrospirae bacterium]|nr:hypothetical protein [Nitrospirota bacterium]